MLIGFVGEIIVVFIDYNRDEFIHLVSFFTFRGVESVVIGVSYGWLVLIGYDCVAFNCTYSTLIPAAGECCTGTSRNLHGASLTEKFATRNIKSTFIIYHHIFILVFTNLYAERAITIVATVDSKGCAACNMEVCLI